MYAVLGATGNTGSVVARELIARGVPIRLIVRDPSKVAESSRERAEVVTADLHDAASLRRALAGVRVLYAMLPPNVGPDMIERASAFAKNLAGAVREAGIGQVVHLSSIGAHQPSGTGPIITNRNLELALRPATRAAVAVRAPFFMENWSESFALLGENKLITFLSPNAALAMIATEDIGRIAARAMLEEAREHAVVELEGPREYSPQDVAEALSTLLGRRIDTLHVPHAQAAATLTQFGVDTTTAAILAEMYEGIDAGRVVHERRGARVERGEVPLEQVLAKLLAR